MAVAGKKAGGWRQRKYLPLYALYHLVKIAAGMVGTAHRTAEYGIAAEKQPVLRQVEAHTALRVAGSFYHLKFQPVGQSVAAGHNVIDGPFVGLVRQPQHMAEGLRPFKNRPVFGVHIYRYRPSLHGVFQAEDMVKMAVGQQYGLDFEAFLADIFCKSLLLALRQGARVYDDALPAFVPHDIAALPQRVEVKNFIHTTKLQTLLLNL